MKRLPFFVYGTLIPNQPNYYLWEKSVINTESGLLKNYQLFDMGHYPMIVESKGSNVEGILIEIKEEENNRYKYIYTLEFFIIDCI